MARTKQKKVYEPIEATPVKSFFVNMLTRDIKLEEAILDLLDNCVDGILRNHDVDGDQPYKGFAAHIEFNKSHFSISDNCGGIPWSLHQYAFRLGRPNGRPQDVSGTVGVYGIGMKRAIFKMGEDALISTQNADDCYEVAISADWLGDEEVWELPVEAGEKTKSDGTTIWIGKLHSGIVSKFDDEKEAFTNELERLIASHYAFIINKGFQVTVNKVPVKPKPTRIVFSRSTVKGAKTIKPFIWTTKRDGVEVFLSVGLTRPIPSEDEVESEKVQSRYSALGAGWTILCNDRAVVYADKTELTGWGEANVPSYHNQFIAISGIVEFRSDDPSKLPTTTTKRGVDASSRLFLQVKNKMREGTKHFTDYTYKWKGREAESKAQMDDEPTMNFEEIKERVKAKSVKMTLSRKSSAEGKQFVPTLPVPKNEEKRTRRVSFSRPIDEIKQVAEYLFKDEDKDPSEVGEKCFLLIKKEASR